MSGWATVAIGSDDGQSQELVGSASSSVAGEELSGGGETAEAREERCRVAYSQALQLMASSIPGDANWGECQDIFLSLVDECSSFSRLDHLRCLCLKNLSSMGEKSGDLEMGLQHGTSAIIVDSSDIGLWLRIFRLSHRSGRTRLARHALERVLKMEPCHPLASTTLARMAESLGEYGLASVLSKRSGPWVSSPWPPAYELPPKRAHCMHLEDIPDIEVMDLDLGYPSWMELGKCLAKLTCSLQTSGEASNSSRSPKSIAACTRVRIRLRCADLEIEGGKCTKRRDEVMESEDKMSDAGSELDEEEEVVDVTNEKQREKEKEKKKVTATSQKGSDSSAAPTRRSRRSAAPRSMDTSSKGLSGAAMSSSSSESISKTILTMLGVSFDEGDDVSTDYAFWQTRFPSSSTPQTIKMGPQDDRPRTTSLTSTYASQVFNLWKKKHEFHCKECQDGGELLCCDFCHRVYHEACIPYSISPTEDLFACPCCKKEAFEAWSKVRYASGAAPLLEQLIARWQERDCGGTVKLVVDYLNGVAQAAAKEELTGEESTDSFREALLELFDFIDDMKGKQWLSDSCLLMLSEIKLVDPTTAISSASFSELALGLNSLVSAMREAGSQFEVRAKRLMGVYYLVCSRSPGGSAMDASKALVEFGQCLSIIRDMSDKEGNDVPLGCSLPHLGTNHYGSLAVRSLELITKSSRAASLTLTAKTEFLAALMDMNKDATNLGTWKMDKLHLGLHEPLLMSASGDALYHFMSELEGMPEVRASINQLIDWDTEKGDIEAVPVAHTSCLTILLWSAALSEKWCCILDVASRLGNTIDAFNLNRQQAQDGGGSGAARKKQSMDNMLLLARLMTTSAIKCKPGNTAGCHGAEADGRHVVSFVHLMLRVSAENKSSKVLRAALDLYYSLRQIAGGELQNAKIIAETVLSGCCWGIVSSIKPLRGAASRGNNLSRTARKQHRLYAATCSEATAEILVVDSELAASSLSRDQISTVVKAILGMLELAEVGEMTQGEKSSIRGYYPTSHVIVSGSLALIELIRLLELGNHHEILPVVDCIHSFLAEKGLCVDGGRRFLLKYCDFLEGFGDDSSASPLFQIQYAQCLRCLFGISVPLSSSGLIVDHVPSLTSNDQSPKISIARAARIYELWGCTSMSRSLIGSLLEVPELCSPPQNQFGMNIEAYLVSLEDESDDFVISNVLPPMSVHGSHDKEVFAGLPEELMPYSYLFKGVYLKAVEVFGTGAQGKLRRSQARTSPSSIESDLQQLSRICLYDLRFSPRRLESWAELSKCAASFVSLYLDAFPVTCHFLPLSSEASGSAAAPPQFRGISPMCDNMFALLKNTCLDSESRISFLLDQIQSHLPPTTVCGGKSVHVGSEEYRASLLPSLTEHAVIVGFIKFAQKCFQVWRILATENGDASALISCCETEGYFSYMVGRDICPPSRVNSREGNLIRIQFLQKSMDAFHACYSKTSPSPSWHVALMLGKLELKLSEGNSSSGLEIQKRALGYLHEAVEQAYKGGGDQDVHIATHRLYETQSKLLLHATERDGAQVLSLLNLGVPIRHKGWAEMRTTALEIILNNLDKCGAADKWSHRPILSRTRILRSTKGLRCAKEAMNPLFEKRYPQIVRMWRGESFAQNWYALNQSGRKFHLSRGNCIREWSSILVELGDVGPLMHLLQSACSCNESGDFGSWAIEWVTKELLRAQKRHLDEIEMSETFDLKDLESAWEVHNSVKKFCTKSEAGDILLAAYSLFCKSIRSSSGRLDRLDFPGASELDSMDFSDLTLDAAIKNCNTLLNGLKQTAIAKAKSKKKSPASAAATNVSAEEGPVLPPLVDNTTECMEEQ